MGYANSIERVLQHHRAIVYIITLSFLTRNSRRGHRERDRSPYEYFVECNSPKRQNFPTSLTTMPDTPPPLPLRCHLFVSREKKVPKYDEVKKEYFFFLENVLYEVKLHFRENNAHHRPLLKSVLQLLDTHSHDTHDIHKVLPKISYKLNSRLSIFSSFNSLYVIHFFRLHYSTVYS